MVSRHLAKAMREGGHHEVKAKNTSLGDLQTNSYPMSEYQAEEWKEALKSGNIKKYREENPYS